MVMFLHIGILDISITYIEINYGKYLAGDKGFTFTLSRKYPNGWQIGGFFTRTDASYEDFGEGSFDKGFFIRIPYSGVIQKTQNLFFMRKLGLFKVTVEPEFQFLDVFMKLFLINQYLI